MGFGEEVLCLLSDGGKPFIIGFHQAMQRFSLFLLHSSTGDLLVIGGVNNAFDEALVSYQSAVFFDEDTVLFVVADYMRHKSYVYFISLLFDLIMVPACYEVANQGIETTYF